MEQETFIDTVSDRTDAGSDAASDATQAVLITLGERLSEDQAGDLADHLPEEFSTYLTEGEAGQRFSEEEFISRVNQRMETVDIAGEQASTAVMGTLLEAVDESQRAAIVDQFEHYGFETLLGETNADVDVTERSPRER